MDVYVEPPGTTGCESVEYCSRVLFVGLKSPSEEEGFFGLIELGRSDMHDKRSECCFVSVESRFDG